jgi:antibiotic biosynthesis monooxygenase (ABM) superfamily enzyme
MPDARDAAATLILGQPVRPGKDGEYAQWQEEVDAAASRYPGFLGSEARPPTASQPEWVVRCRFDSADRAYNWLNSATRQDYLNNAADLFDGPGTQQIIAPDEPDEKVSDALVTVMVTHKVANDKVDEFRVWQDEMLRAESRYPGFRGSEVFRPVEGVQDDWVICYRYDSAEHLDAWLTSEDRKNLFNRPEFADFHLRRIDHPSGSWFTYGVNDPPPSDWKTSLAVWFGLYPTAVILEVLSRQLHLHMKFWLDMLVGVVAGNVMMIYFTQPYYGNRVLHWWLNPAKNARQPATNIGGTLLVAAVMTLVALLAYLGTVKFWTLPPP